MKRESRAVLVLVIFCVALMILLAVLLPAETRSREEAKPEQTVISLVYAYQNSQWNACVEEVIRRFEEEHPEIDVQYEIRYEDMVYEDMLNKLAARDELGDVVQLKEPYAWAESDLFFAYTRYGYGESKPQMEELDVVKLIEQLIEEFYPNMQENALELEIEKQTASVIIAADGMLLARAFANLLGNAIKYGRDGKNIIIRMERQVLMEQKEWFVVHITNFGEVIPEKDLEHIFERFYRVDASRGEQQGGTGLGLAIVQNIIRQHKGEVRVRSDLDGTCFTVLLPIESIEEE